MPPWTRSGSEWREDPECGSPIFSGAILPGWPALERSSMNSSPLPEERTVFSDLEALYGPVSPEEFLVREIDLLLAPEGGEVLLPSTGFLWCGSPRTWSCRGPIWPRSAWQLAEILHPEVFR